MPEEGNCIAMNGGSQWNGMLIDVQSDYDDRPQLEFHSIRLRNDTMSPTCCARPHNKRDTIALRSRVRVRRIKIRIEWLRAIWISRDIHFSFLNKIRLEFTWSEVSYFNEKTKMLCISNKIFTFLSHIAFAYLGMRCVRVREQHQQRPANNR